MENLERRAGGPTGLRWEETNECEIQKIYPQQRIDTNAEKCC
jgi:hypothetical protein